MTFSLYKKLYIALLGLLIVFVAVTFKQYGISNDEQVQHVYGQLLLKFYSSGFEDHAAFAYKNLYLYGGFFDLIAASLEKILPLWVWDIRHLISALFGIAGIVAVYKTTEKLAGERAALLAALLLTMTGAWTGAMFTHTKDVSFGACMAWALYYTTLISERFERVPVHLSVKLGIAIGCALGLRIGGAFAVIYLLMLVMIASLIQTSSLKAKLSFYTKAIIGLLPAGFTAFMLMAVFWPWALMGADHILIAAKSFSHFAFNMNTIVDGTFVSIGEVSRSYLIQYLIIRLPEVFLVGLLCVAILFLVRLPQQFKQSGFLKNQLPNISLAIAILFPILFVLADKPALYNGVRHFTFIIPPLAILAGIGLSTTWDALQKQPKLKFIYALLATLLALNTCYVLFELRPYQYIYYNHFAGKNLQQAEHRWEADYWSSSLIDATKMLENHLDAEQKNWPSNHQGPYFVAVCAEAFQGRAYLDDRFSITENWVRADFFLSTTHMNCDKVLKGTIIGTVERLGAPLSVVKDRRELTGEDRRPRAAPRN